MRSRQIAAIIIATGMALAGCNLAGNPKPENGPQAVFTAAAQTLEAQLTQPILPDSTDLPTADVLAAASDTPFPAASATAGPVSTGAASSSSGPVPANATQPCDAAKFIADVTIPDGTVLARSESFTKTWRFTNIGSCTWNSSYSLVFDNGDSMSGPASQPLTATVPPGGQFDLSLSLQAPDNPGSYRGYWRLRNPSGLFLPVTNGYKSKSFYVDIQVKNGVSRPDFAVTSVQFSVSHSGSCAAGTYTVTAKVIANGAGDVSYTWGRSDGFSDPLSTGTLTFSAADTQTLSYNWSSGATGLSMTLYIDSPNHQNFGTALLNCP